MWTARLEGSPAMLDSAIEGREDLTLQETLAIVTRMLGATRDGFTLIAREIDKLNSA
jgi:hypothetical protein